jgi:hypothetical protein
MNTARSVSLGPSYFWWTIFKNCQISYSQRTPSLRSRAIFPGKDHGGSSCETARSGLSKSFLRARMGLCPASCLGYWIQIITQFWLPGTPKLEVWQWYGYSSCQTARSWLSKWFMRARMGLCPSSCVCYWIQLITQFWLPGTPKLEVWQWYGYSSCETARSGLSKAFMRARTRLCPSSFVGYWIQLITQFWLPGILKLEVWQWYGYTAFMAHRMSKRYLSFLQIFSSICCITLSIGTTIPIFSSSGEVTGVL